MSKEKKEVVYNIVRYNTVIKGGCTANTVYHGLRGNVEMHSIQTWLMMLKQEGRIESVSNLDGRYVRKRKLLFKYRVKELLSLHKKIKKIIKTVNIDEPRITVDEDNAESFDMSWIDEKYFLLLTINKTGSWSVYGRIENTDLEVSCENDMKKLKIFSKKIKEMIKNA